MDVSNRCGLSSLSHELLCHILSYLPLKHVLLLGTLNKYLLAAVELHLHLLKEVDFCEDEIIGYMPPGITDKHLFALLDKCPNVEIIYGFHPVKLDRLRLRRSNALSIPGIIDALLHCPNLRKVETSNFRLLEAFSQHLPHLQIAGHFRNRDGVFPAQRTQQVKLSPFLRLTSLHLIGVQLPELARMPELQHLYLQWVSFTRLHPFRSFSAMKLKTFVMKHCIGPSFPLRYYPLFIALGFAPDLTRLEIVRVPILGGMIHRSVEEAFRNNGFRKISKLVVGDCKGIMESDLGQLMIAASQSLKTLHVQASLTKDSLFVSLHFARCNFPLLKTLHLGYVDDFPPKGEWSNDTLLGFGLADVPDVPSSITDSGIKTVSLLFPNVENLTITNCQHIVNPKLWIPEGHSLWDNLDTLILERCHCVYISSFTLFLPDLEKIEVLVLKNMFREPPKGCSHVGLSAGTGLGLSSAIVSTRDEHIAVQGHHVDDQENDNAGLENEQEHGFEGMHPHPEGRRNGLNVGLQEVQEHLNENVEQNENLAAGPSNSRGTTSRRQRANSRRARPNEAEKPNSRLSAGNKKSNHNACSSRKRKCTNKPLGASNGPSTRNSPKRGRANRAKQSTSSAGPSVDSNVSGNSYSGPLTRSRRKMMKVTSADESSSSSQVPQKTSSGKSAQKKSSATRGPQRKTRSSCRVEPDCSRKRYAKASSTSDSYSEDEENDDDEEEEDITVVFYVLSQSLISLTIISCGISEIKFDRCSNLVHIEAQGCRILKKFDFNDSQALKKVNIIQCPKLDLTYFVSGIMNLYSATPLLVYIRPSVKDHNYSCSSIEETVLRYANVDHSLVLLHNYYETEDDSAPFRENLLCWLDYMHSSIEEIHPISLLLRATGSEGSISDSYIYSPRNIMCSEYPWGHHVENIYGSSQSGDYQLMTNNKIFAAFWRKNEIGGKSSNLRGSSIFKLDVPDLLEFDVGDMFEDGLTLGKHQVGFFIDVKI